MSMRKSLARLTALMISPAAFVIAALLIIAAYLITTALDWRPCTSILSGSLPTPEASVGPSIFRGVVYTITYLAAIVLAPILLLAAAILKLLLHRYSPTAQHSPPTPNQSQ